MKFNTGDIISIGRDDWLNLEREGYDEHCHDPNRYELVEEEVDEPVGVEEFFTETEQGEPVPYLSDSALRMVGLALMLEETMATLEAAGYVSGAQMMHMGELFVKLQMDIADAVLNMFREKEGDA